MSDSIKAVAKAIKAAGLQKLRWYCQMCAKQCRDENGFKCHCLSESHLRQMELFRQNPGQFIEGYSHQFERAFLDILRRKGGRFVKANEIYQEQIADREHVRMNSTKWDTLSSFVQYLGKSKLASVEQDEKGTLWVKYLRGGERNGTTNTNGDKTGEIAYYEDEIIQRRIAAAMKQLDNPKAAEDSSEEEIKENKRETTKIDQPIKISLITSGAAQVKRERNVELMFAESAREAAIAPQNQPAISAKRKFSALESIIAENEAAKARAAAAAQRANANPLAAASATPSSVASAAVPAAAAAPVKVPLPISAAPTPAPLPVGTWLIPGLIVKIVNGSPLNGEKVTIESVQQSSGQWTAVIRTPSGDHAALPEAELETVLPSVNQRVRLVQGPHRGQFGTLIKVDSDEFVCTVRLLDAGQGGTLIERLEFEDLCKVTGD